MCIRDRYSFSGKSSPILAYNSVYSLGEVNLRKDIRLLSSFPISPASNLKPSTPYSETNTFNEFLNQSTAFGLLKSSSKLYPFHQRQTAGSLFLFRNTIFVFATSRPSFESALTNGHTHSITLKPILCSLAIISLGDLNRPGWNVHVP